MAVTIVETLAEFAVGVLPDQIPARVVEETKRILLDSLGCAVGGVETPKGAIGIEYGKILGGGSSDATILGSGLRSSVFGAAFANGELINALDFDAVLPPGHVAPYVVPGALALAEYAGRSGPDIIAALAVAHEISYRFGRSMDTTRDTSSGKVAVSDVLGYTSTIFGATAANSMLRTLPAGTVANALAIAAATSPVNSHRSWMNGALSSTVKYTGAGVMARSALDATYLAELGHRGDLLILDDAEYGYRRFIGSQRWLPEKLTEDLGSDWRFPAESSFKPYPHCRVMHALFDALGDVQRTNGIRPDEIEEIRAWGEGWIMLPVWLNQRIEQVHDAQFSVTHGLAVAAQGIVPGPGWQDPDVVFDPAVLDLMKRIDYQPHADWVTAIERHPASRPSRIEVDARGQTFVGERSYPKGSPSPDTNSFMSTQELVDKFLVNAVTRMDSARAERAAAAVLDLENVENISSITTLLA